MGTISSCEDKTTQAEEFNGANPSTGENRNRGRDFNRRMKEERRPQKEEQGGEVPAKERTGTGGHVDRGPGNMWTGTGNTWTAPQSRVSRQRHEGRKVLS